MIYASPFHITTQLTEYIDSLSRLIASVLALCAWFELCMCQKIHTTSAGRTIQNPPGKNPSGSSFMCQPSRYIQLVCADVELLLGSLNLRFATAHIVKHDHCNNKEPQRRAKREPEIPAGEACNEISHRRTECNKQRIRELC